MQAFFDFPTESFQLRQISRKVKIAVPSVKRYLKELQREGVVLVTKRGLYPTYKANRENELFKFYKTTDLLERMKKSGLVDYIGDACMPDIISLFGSAARGEDVETSDIDIFVQSIEKKLNLGKYEKILNRRIALFFEERFSKLSKELKNNIINGIKLSGYLKAY